MGRAIAVRTDFTAGEVPAGFGSEQVAGFRLECMAGFIGSRNPCRDVQIAPKWHNDRGR